MKWSLQVAVWIFSMALAMGTASAQDKARLKVAEGTYVMDTESGGEKMKYHEEWVLWSTSQGTYLVESKIRVACDHDNSEFRSEIFLDSTLRPVSLRIQREIPGLKTKDEFALTFTDEGVRYSVGDKEYEEKIQGPYYMYLPFPWFLSAIAVGSTKERGRNTAIQLVWMDDHSDPPIELFPFFGKIRYEGAEQIQVGGQSWNAERFEIAPHPFSPITIWISSEGILLALQDARKPEQRIELKSSRMYRDFSPRAQGGE